MSLHRVSPKKNKISQEYIYKKQTALLHIEISCIESFKKEREKAIRIKKKKEKRGVEGKR
jgi:hypothetical protein